MEMNLSYTMESMTNAGKMRRSQKENVSWICNEK